MQSNEDFFEYPLNYQNNWISHRRRWHLPYQFYKSIDRVKLFINGAEIPESDFDLKNGMLLLLNKSITINNDTIVISEISLKSRAKIDSFTQNVILALIAIIPATLSALLVYFVNLPKEVTNSTDSIKKSLITGRPLAYHDYYPVYSDSTGKLLFNKDKFLAACKELKNNEDIKSASDLIYLVRSNNIDLTTAEKDIYENLVDKYEFSDDFNMTNSHREHLLYTYKQIVNGIGETFAGTNIEIVLHDIRNPLKSIVTIQNPISGRKVGDPTTNFGLQLIKDYAQIDHLGDNYVSYSLRLKSGEKIKSTTIPIYDTEYGLIAFICLNIRIGKFGESKYLKEFVANISTTVENSKIDELIQNSKFTSNAQKSK